MPPGARAADNVGCTPPQPSVPAGPERGQRPSNPPLSASSRWGSARQRAHEASMRHALWRSQDRGRSNGRGGRPASLPVEPEGSSGYFGRNMAKLLRRPHHLRRRIDVFATKPHHTVAPAIANHSGARPVGQGRNRSEQSERTLDASKRPRRAAAATSHVASTTRRRAST